MTELVARTRLGGLARPRIGGLLVFERNVLVYRRTWLILLSGFFEPLFYLVFFVVPLSSIVGDIELNGDEVAYAAFVAPALLAASAMNGAFYDATNVFWKLRYGKVYDAMLSTPGLAAGRRDWRDALGGLACAALLGSVPARHHGARVRRVAVGGPRAPGLPRDRIRLRRRRASPR